MDEQVLTLITTIALVLMAIVGTAVILADVVRWLSRRKLTEYQSNCPHDELGYIFDENVCLNCGKVMPK